MEQFHANVLELEKKGKHLHGPSLDPVAINELQEIV
jgi:hypothetical protein